jgi:putative salt-induced outer membrane protein
MGFSKLLITASCCLPLLLAADQVILTNGDRITGSIVSVDDKTVVLKTAAMGEVKIDRTAVASFETGEPLTVTLKKGEKVVGKVAAAEEKTSITTPAGSVVTVPQADVQAVRTAAGQAAWEREETRRTHPPLLDFWSGTAGVNLAFAGGNAKTTTLGAGATVQRVTGFDKITLVYSQIYSTQSTVRPFGATANRISGSARYDRNITGKLFGFAINSYDFDEFLDLDLRTVLGGGLGFHAYKSAKSYWDVGAGADWSREAFGTGLVRNSAEMLVTEESSHQLNKTMQLTQRLSVFPNLSRGGDYRIDFDGGASFKLTKLLTWNVTLTDRFLSNPLPGKQRNDVLLTTGIAIAFEQK